MTRSLVPGGIVAALVGSMLIASCGIDTTGALETSSPDGGSAPIDGGRDATLLKDASGGQDTSTADVVSPPIDAAPPDDGAAPPPDAAPPPPDTGIDSGIDTGVDAGCTSAVGCFVLPAGWNVVAFAGAAGASCPAGFTKNSRDVLESPATAGAGACTCDSCAVSMPPNCQQGQIGIKYDTDGSKTCGTPFLETLNADGKCDGFFGPFQIQNNADGQLTPPAPQGGACSAAPPTKHLDQITTGHDHLCDPDSPSSAGCAGNECTPTPGGGFQGCIVHPNDVACPVGIGLDTKHLVGSSINFDCPSTCTCSFTAACDGTVTYFTDNNCKNNGLPQTVDGVCRPVGGTGSFATYLFKAQPTASCAATGTSTAQNVALTGVSTVCCPP